MSQYNRYCWLCVQSANVEEETCSVCHRSYHGLCKLNQARQLPLWLKNVPCLQALLAAKPSCWVCQHIAIFEHIYSQRDYAPMNRAIQKVIEKLNALPESGPFRQFPETKYNYAKFMVSPMYLQKIYDRTTVTVTPNNTPNNSTTTTDLRPYKSPEEFFYDLQLIVFNCKVANGARTALYSCAKVMYDVGAEEYCRLSYCYQCYNREEEDGHFRHSDHFLASCIRPHSIVWAKQTDSGPYTAAKVVNVRDRRTTRDIDVVFFGTRQLLTRVKLRDCYAFSRKRPSADEAIAMNSIADSQMAIIEDEVRRYVDAIRTEHHPASCNENGFEDSLENSAVELEKAGFTVYRERDTRFDETMLYMNKISYRFCPITLPTN